MLHTFLPSPSCPAFLPLPHIGNIAPTCHMPCLLFLRRLRQGTVPHTLHLCPSHILSNPYLTHFATCPHTHHAPLYTHACPHTEPQPVCGTVPVTYTHSTTTHMPHYILYHCHVYHSQFWLCLPGLHATPACLCLHYLPSACSLHCMEGIGRSLLLLMPFTLLWEDVQATSVVA